MTNIINHSGSMWGCFPLKGAYIVHKFENAVCISCTVHALKHIILSRNKLQSPSALFQELGIEGLTAEYNH